MMRGTYLLPASLALAALALTSFVLEPVQPKEVPYFKAMKTPNDQHYSGYQQDYTTAIGLDETWDYTSGTSGQLIGVVDTGLVFAADPQTGAPIPHEDLNGRIYAGFDFISNPADSMDQDGRDAVPQDPGYCQRTNTESYHGTHVAGIMAAAGDNGLGIAGVDWASPLVVARAANPCQLANPQDVIDAIRWLSGLPIESGGIAPEPLPRPVSVINLSLALTANTYCPEDLQSTIDAANAAGVVIVAASGNNGQTVVPPPGNCRGVITVSAYGLDETQEIVPTEFSNFDQNVDIIAPGVDVMSAWGPAINDYTLQDGTSMAAPYVAGTVGLIRSLYPYICINEVERVLKQGGFYCDRCGSIPALDVFGALDLASEASQCQFVVPVVEPPVTSPLTCQSGGTTHPLFMSFFALIMIHHRRRHKRKYLQE